MNLSVVCCHNQDNIWWQYGKYFCHKLIRITQLGFVVRTKATFVRNLVNSVVVRVHKIFTGIQRLIYRDRNTARRTPTHGFDTSEVCHRKSAAFEFCFAEDRNTGP